MKYFILAFFSIGLPVLVQAQQYKSLSKKDTIEINLQASKTLENLGVALRSLSDPENTESEKKGIADGYFTHGKIFIDKKQTTIEDDLDPTIHSRGEEPMAIADYLDRLQMVFKPAGDNAINVTLKDISPVISGDIPRLYVFFSQTYNGKFSDPAKSATAYIPNRRIAEMLVFREEKNWKVYINKLIFDDGTIPVIDPAQKYIPVSDAAPEQEDLMLKDESYYKHLLDIGTVALTAGNYTDAYVLLKEANLSRGVHDLAQTRLIELRSKMRKSGIFETDSFLHKTVLVKAEKAALKHRYEEARKLYEYSLNLNLLDRKIPQKIQLLTAKINKQQQLDGLYEKGLYNDAVMGYIEALSDDKDNATLLAGRARCNARLGLDSRAEADFTKAIAIDNTNITTYKYMGEYYKNKRKPDYDKAYNAYASYVNFSENKEAPELPAIYSEMAVCKGQAAFAKNSISEALDSFGRAIEYYPQNAGAYLNKAICYYKQNNYTEALTNVEKSIELKEKNAEGHYWLGKIKLSNPSNKKDHTDEAIEELKLAISYNDNYLVANFDLGDLMQRKGTWADAIPYFTKCISIDSNFASAYWKRGLSHYHIASYAVAYTDFNRYALFDFVNLGFYVDFGNLYLQLMQPDNAITWFNKAPNSTESVFGIAVATYLKAPGDPQKKYIEYFEKAFIKGINADLVNASPVVKKLKNDDKDYKELIKKYKNYK